MSATPNASAVREARRLLITGKVQGVGYRWNMVQEATRLGLTGWVRNRADGSVEAMACGDDAALAAFLAWSRNGPSGSQVAQVHVERVTEGGEQLIDFVQRATM